MKNYSLKFLLILSLFFSCKKKKEDVRPEVVPVEVAPSGPYLVSITKVRTQTMGAISLIIRNFAPTLVPLLPEMNYDVDTYKIRYKTTYKGNATIASGIICVPRTDTVLFPTLSFQHGTLFDVAEVPSNSFIQQVQISALASAGYFSLSPDYLGFDSVTRFMHPYYIAQYSANAVRDMLLASEEFSKMKNIKLNKQLFLAGYSQGGNVTMAAMKSIESKPVGNFELTASAAGAGGYNLNGIFKTITARDSFPSPNYIAYIVQSFRISNDWNTPLSYYFKEPFASRIPNLINGTTSANTINANLSERLDTLLQQNFIASVKNGTDLQFSNALSVNSLYDWKPNTPLRLYHGDQDEVVPFSDSDSTYRHMLNLGATSVSFVPLPNQDHSSGALPMVSDVLVWFNSLVK